LEEIIFENFNISENNVISVELAKVLRYIGCVQCAPNPLPKNKNKNKKKKSIVNLKYQSHFWLISCSVFFGGENFRTVATKK